MGEVYVGAFRCEGGDARLVDRERVAKPDGVVLPDGTWIGSGTGFGAVEGLLPRTLGDRLQSFDATALPHAADVARLAVHAFERGEAVAPERAEPAYLRDNVALTLVEQQAARAARQP